MKDSAELWLIANDPDYESESSAWANVRSGYRPPRQEVAWGDGEDVTDRVHRALAGAAIADPVPHKLCARCGDPFVPNTPWHRFCGLICRVASHRSVTHSS